MRLHTGEGREVERVNDIFTVCRVCFDSAGGETEAGRRWLFLGVRECHVFTVGSLAHGVSGVRMERWSVVPEESFESPVFHSLSSSDLSGSSVQDWHWL